MSSRETAPGLGARASAVRARDRPGQCIRCDVGQLLDLPSSVDLDDIPDTAYTWLGLLEIRAQPRHCSYSAPLDMRLNDKRILIKKKIHGVRTGCPHPGAQHADFGKLAVDLRPSPADVRFPILVPSG